MSTIIAEIPLLYGPHDGAIAKYPCERVPVSLTISGQYAHHYQLYELDDRGPRYIYQGITDDGDQPDNV